MELLVGVIGALDGTLIPVGSVPAYHQDEYINRRMQHSVNLMAVCNVREQFIYAFAGFPCSAYDARVFQISAPSKDLELNERGVLYSPSYHLLGDIAHFRSTLT